MQDTTKSIITAFNLGVWRRQQDGGTDKVLEVTKELRDIIYWDISKQYQGKYPDDIIQANVEYILGIALLGYILPGVTFYDEELKTRLFTLIETRLESGVQQPIEQNSQSIHY